MAGRRLALVAMFMQPKAGPEQGRNSRGSDPVSRGAAHAENDSGQRTAIMAMAGGQGVFPRPRPTRN